MKLSVLLVSAAGLVLRVAAQAPCDIAKLHASDSAPGDNFAHALAASGDSLVVGAPFDDDLGNSTGAAYFYRRTGAGTWVQVGKVVPQGAAAGDQCGIAVAIDADRAAIGATLDDDAAFNSGSVWIYELGPGGWMYTDKLVASDGATNDDFGYSIAISGDYAIVGAPRDDDAGVDSGAAYLFRRGSSGQWSQVKKLLGSDLVAGARFGISVAIQGNVALVGAHQQTTTGGQSGAAYAFELGGSGWAQTFKLYGNDATSFDNFGYSVAIDGNQGLIGAPLDDDTSTSTGSVYVFRRAPDTTWLQTDKLHAPDPLFDDQFGAAVSSRDGWLAVGAPYKDVGGSNRGGIYLFRHPGSDWEYGGAITAADGANSDQLGFTTAALDHTLIGGARLDDDVGLDSGTAYVFEYADAAALTGCPSALSVVAGGTQYLRLDVGDALGNKLYFTLGSLSGTSPGLPVDGLVLPLNVDAYFLFTLNAPNSPLLSNSLGITSTTGTALTTLNLPAGAFPVLVGQTVHHATAVLGAFGAGPVLLTSNAAALAFVP